MNLPATYIDPQDIELMASYFATKDEMAAFYGISLKSFESRLARTPALRKALERGRAAGKLALREAQMNTALGRIKGNAAVLVWLGKQADILAQEENPKSSRLDVNTTIRYVAEWGATPQTLGQDAASSLEDSSAEWEDDPSSDDAEWSEEDD